MNGIARFVVPSSSFLPSFLFLTIITNTGSDVSLPPHVYNSGILTTLTNTIMTISNIQSVLSSPLQKESPHLRM